MRTENLTPAKFFFRCLRISFATSAVSIQRGRGVVSTFILTSGAVFLLTRRTLPVWVVSVKPLRRLTLPECGVDDARLDVTRGLADVLDRGAEPDLGELVTTYRLRDLPCGRGGERGDDH